MADTLAAIRHEYALESVQNYPILGGADLADFGSVVIWCEGIGLLISPATLQPVGG